MQVKQVRWPGLAALVLVSLMVSGCGQKGPLYREAPVPALENSTETQQSDDKPES
jgi:predicted small lipoprotein YifL